MARKKIAKKRPAIDLQEIAAETGQRSYEILGLTRVKCAENPYMLPDLRIFQQCSGGRFCR